MSKNLLRDWMDGEDVDDVTFEKFTNRKGTRENREGESDVSRIRKEKERERWNELEED